MGENKWFIEGIDDTSVRVHNPYFHRRTSIQIQNFSYSKGVPVYKYDNVTCLTDLTSGRVLEVFAFHSKRKLLKWPLAVPPSDGKHLGVVKKFVADKKYGFIYVPSFSKLVFVHASQISSVNEAVLHPGEEVELKIEKNDTNGRFFAKDVSGPYGCAVEGAFGPLLIK